MTPLLSCQSLAKSFAAHPLFRNISFGVQPDERLGLIGPNGSGKSTLLRILAGDEEPDEGEVSRRRDLRLAYVPQTESFRAGLTVADVLDAAIDPVLEPYERAALLNRILADVGFAETSQRVETLSGGWRSAWRSREALSPAGPAPPRRADQPPRPRRRPLARAPAIEARPFALLLVSHDRYFLENVTNRTHRAQPRLPRRLSSASQGTYSEFLRRRRSSSPARRTSSTPSQGKVKQRDRVAAARPKARTTQGEGPDRPGAPDDRRARRSQGPKRAGPDRRRSTSTPPAARPTSCS